MRISDWSSDVCSSDLAADGDAAVATCIGGGRRTGRAGQAARAVAARQNLNRFAFAVRLAVRRAGLRRQATINYAGNGRAARLVGELVYRSIAVDAEIRSEEHTSELQSLMRISYAVFCLKKKTTKTQHNNTKN